MANSDTQGIRQRRAALALAARALREAAHEQRAMEDLTDTEHNLRLVVREHRHIVKSSRKRGRKGVQVTKGVSWSTMIADAPRLVGIFTEARGRWMSYYGIYSDHLQQKYSDGTFNPGVVELYGMLAGHPVPDFTINNECGFAFEVRSAKQEDRALYGI